MKTEKTYKIDFANGLSTLVNQMSLEGVKVVHQNDKEMVIESNNKIFTVQINHFDELTKRFEMTVNHRKIQLQLKDDLDQLVEKMGLDIVADDSLSVLEAPMPGLVIDVLVNENDQIEKGTPLLVLEAMKMENIIKAKGSAEVDKILIKKGDKVEKSQLLIEFK